MDRALGVGGGDRVDRQRAAPGDLVHIRCTWDNPSDTDILPGPYTSNEMCTLGLLVWPAEAARWERGGCR